MILLDAGALVGLLGGEPAAGDVEDLLRSGEVWITAVNYAEVLDQVIRRQGRSPTDAALVLDPLVMSGILQISAVRPPIGDRAGRLRSRHYDRRTCPLSLADCVLLAAASVDGGRVATSDHLVVQVARAEGIDVVALPNSRGDRPT